MDARDILILGAGAAALFYFSRRASAAVPYVAPASGYTPPSFGAWAAFPTYDSALVNVGDLPAVTVQDIEDAEMFRSDFPGWIETQTPDDYDTGGYDEFAEGGNIMQTGAGNRNLDAFLRLLRRLEVGTDGPEGYGRVHTSVAKLIGTDYISDFRDHPRVRAKFGSSTTSAAGAYQFQIGTWDEAAGALGLRDFSPASQDAAAVWLIDSKRRALSDILAGNIRSAVRKLRNEWSSLPGAKEAQLNDAGFDQLYLSYGGAFAPGEGGAVYV